MAAADAAAAVDEWIELFRPAGSEQIQHFDQVKEEHRPREKMVACALQEIPLS